MCASTCAFILSAFDEDEAAAEAEAEADCTMGEGITRASAGERRADKRKSEEAESEEVKWQGGWGTEGETVAQQHEHDEYAVQQSTATR